MTPRKKRLPNRKSLHLRIDRAPPPPFQNFQTFLLNSFTHLSPSAAALGCLIGFDLVISQSQLPAAYASLRSVHLFRNRPHIRWVVDENDTDQANKAATDTHGRQQVPIYDERAISVFTLHCVLRATDWKTFEESSHELMGVLQAHQTRGALPPTLIDLLASGHEYAATSLSSAVRSHVVGDFQMVALDPAAVVRESTKKPLVAPELDMELEEAMAASEAQIRRLNVRQPTETYTDQAVRSRQENLVKQIVRACNVGAQMNPAAARRAVSQELAAVHSLLGDGDHLPRLLVLVAFDMVQQQTLAMTSIGRYFTGAATRLFDVLYPMNVTQLNADNIESSITTAIDNASPSNKASVRAVGQLALHLLARHELIDEIALSKKGGRKAVVSVRAQVIWPHEVNWGLEWLDAKVSEGPPGPVLPAVRCAIGLMAETGMRIREALWLRVNALSFQHDHLQILINPGRSDRAVKSQESKRLIEVTNHRVMKYMLDILEKRHSAPIPKSHDDALNQDASRTKLNESLRNSSSYLFGDPDNDGQIWDEVEVRKWISVVLKQSTGDVRSSAHDLRHSWPSLGNEVDFCSRQCDDPVTYDRRANSLGHSASDLMFTTYTHLFGSGIRAMIDHQLTMDSVLEIRPIALWSVGLSRHSDAHNGGDKELSEAWDRSYANVRASLSRRKIKAGTRDTQIHLLDYLEEVARKVDVGSTADVLKVAVQDTPPSFRPFSSKGISIHSILAALNLIAVKNQGQPMSDEEVATQSGLTLPQTVYVKSEFKSISRAARGVKPPPVLHAHPEGWLVASYWKPHLASARSQKWLRVLSYLNKSFELEDSALAADYVIRQMGVGPILPAVPTDRGFASLIRTIKASGLNTSALRLSSVRADDDMHESEYVQASLRQVLGVTVPVENVAYRPERPSVYLSIRSEQSIAKASKGRYIAEPTQDGRSYSMMGFSALFLASLLKAKLIKGAKGE